MERENKKQRCQIKCFYLIINNKELEKTETEYECNGIVKEMSKRTPKK